MKPKARRAGVLVTDLGDEVLLLDQRANRAHCLSRTAGLIWKFADGRTTEAALADHLALDLGEAVSDDTVVSTLGELDAAGLLERTTDPSASHYTRRAMLSQFARAGSVALAVTSLALPTPSMAASVDGGATINACLAGTRFVPDQLVVGFKPGQSPAELTDPARIQAIQNTYALLGVQSVGAPLQLPSGFVYLLQFGPGTDLCRAMDVLRALPEVGFVEANIIGGNV
jgi:hypothetical protein